MAESIYYGDSYGMMQYTLRASGPMPVYGPGFSTLPVSYVIHSFGADVSTIDIYECTENLLPSSMFRGQSPTGPLTSASFSSVGDKEGKIFQGRAVHYPTFQEETYGGFNNNLFTCVGGTP